MCDWKVQKINAEIIFHHTYFFICVELIVWHLVETRKSVARKKDWLRKNDRSFLADAPTEFG